MAGLRIHLALTSVGASFQHVPRKIRQLVSELEKAGFVNRGGKGSHRNFIHSESGARLTLSGQSGEDAKIYQEKDVKEAIRKAKGQ